MSNKTTLSNSNLYFFEIKHPRHRTKQFSLSIGVVSVYWFVTPGNAKLHVEYNFLCSQLYGSAKFSILFLDNVRLHFNSNLALFLCGVVSGARKWEKLNCISKPKFWNIWYIYRWVKKRFLKLRLNFMVWQEQEIYTIPNILSWAF